MKDKTTKPLLQTFQFVGIILVYSDGVLLHVIKFSVNSSANMNTYYMASSASGQDERNHCDWLPERTRWNDLDCLGLPAVSRKQNFPKSHKINPLLNKFVRSRWLDIGLVLFCEFMDLNFVSVHKHAKKELGQYPAILTPHLVNNPYFFATR